MSRQASRHQQAFTTRWRGADMTLVEISLLSGIPLSRLSARYKAGKRGDELTAERRGGGRYASHDEQGGRA